MAGRTNCIALDDSDYSYNSFNWYVANYHRDGDTLILLHIHEMPIIKLLGGSVPLAENYQETVQASFLKSQHVLQKFRNVCDEKGVGHKVVMENNIHSAGQMICEMAKHHAADVIIMGQRGLGTVSRVLLGSTSDFVLHHSHVPVIVVPLNP